MHRFVSWLMLGTLCAVASLKLESTATVNRAELNRWLATRPYGFEWPYVCDHLEDIPILSDEDTTTLREADCKKRVCQVVWDANAQRCYRRDETCIGFTKESCDKADHCFWFKNMCRTGYKRLRPGASEWFSRTRRFCHLISIRNHGISEGKGILSAERIGSIKPFNSSLCFVESQGECIWDPELALCIPSRIKQPFYEQAVVLRYTETRYNEYVHFDTSIGPRKLRCEWLNITGCLLETYACMWSPDLFVCVSREDFRGLPDLRYDKHLQTLPEWRIPEIGYYVTDSSQHLIDEFAEEDSHTVSGYSSCFVMLNESMCIAHHRNCRWNVTFCVPFGGKVVPNVQLPVRRSHCLLDVMDGGPLLELQIHVGKSDTNQWNRVEIIHWWFKLTHSLVGPLANQFDTLLGQYGDQRPWDGFLTQRFSPDTTTSHAILTAFRVTTFPKGVQDIPIEAMKSPLVECLKSMHARRYSWQSDALQSYNRLNSSIASMRLYALWPRFRFSNCSTPPCQFGENTEFRPPIDLVALPESEWGSLNLHLSSKQYLKRDSRITVMGGFVHAHTKTIGIEMVSTIKEEAIPHWFVKRVKLYTDVCLDFLKDCPLSSKTAKAPNHILEINLDKLDDEILAQGFAWALIDVLVGEYVNASNFQDLTNVSHSEWNWWQLAYHNFILGDQTSPWMQYLIRFEFDPSIRDAARKRLEERSWAVIRFAKSVWTSIDKALEHPADNDWAFEFLKFLFEHIGSTGTIIVVHVICLLTLCFVGAVVYNGFTNVLSHIENNKTNPAFVSLQLNSNKKNQ